MKMPFICSNMSAITSATTLTHFCSATPWIPAHSGAFRHPSFQRRMPNVKRNVKSVTSEEGIFAFVQAFCKRQWHRLRLHMHVPLLPRFRSLPTVLLPERNQHLLQRLSRRRRPLFLGLRHRFSGQRGRTDHVHVECQPVAPAGVCAKRPQNRRSCEGHGGGFCSDDADLGGKVRGVLGEVFAGRGAGSPVQQCGPGEVLRAAGWRAQSGMRPCS